MSDKNKKSLKQMEEEIIAAREKQEAERRGIGRFPNGPTALSRFLANRPQDREVVYELETGRMQQPPTVFPRPKSVVVHGFTPPITCGTVSGHIARARAAEEECSKQVKFFRLLETKYGAVKGNEYSYGEAMMRYHNDKDVKMREKMKQQEADQRREDRFRELNDGWSKADAAAAAQFPRREQKVVYAQPRGMRQDEEQAQQEKDFKEYWQREQDRARAYAHAHAQYEPPRQRPASPKKRTPTSPRSILIEQYPIPHTRREAIAVMGLPSHPEPTDREIKLAFNAQALRLHPDKNAHNPVEAAVRFDQLHHAYKLLRKQGGGGRGRRRGTKGKRKSRHGRASRASRASRYRRKTHRRRHSVKIHKKTLKNNTTRKHK